MRTVFLVAAMVCALQAKSQIKGQEVPDSMLRALSVAKEDTVKVKLLTDISKWYSGVNPRAGFRYADSGMALAQKLDWKRGIANLYNNLGLLTGDTGNNNAGIVYFEKSFAINKELDAKPFMIANMNNIGRIYQREAKFAEASEYYFKGMTIAEESGNNEQAALLGTNITALYITQQDYRKAAEYAAITIKKGEAAKVPVHVAKAYELLGVINQEQNDTAEARRNYNKALSIDEEIGNKMAMVGVLSNIGTLYPDPEKIPIFIKIQQMLDEIAPASQNSILNLANLGLTYYNLGMSAKGEERKKDFDHSEAYLKRGEALCISTNNPEYKADIKQALADLEEAKGDYQAALQDYRAFKAINDSIYSQENKNKIAALEGQRAIDLKNKEIENKELQIGNQQKKMWLMVSGIAFLAILGGLAYRQSLTRKKTNTTLLQLNNELGLANSIKAKFFGIISHDLRRPVANLLNFLELQKRAPGKLSEDQIIARENKMTSSARSLLETMDSMLLWSKGQMEYFEPDISAVPVSDLFSHLQKLFADTGQVVFSYSNGEDLIVNTDRDYLQTIMHNLTANAINALSQTPNARIEWKAWGKNDKIFFSITDNGPGIPKEQLKNLFDETAVRGSRHGLGLHIIRDLAKAIGCNISLQPSDKGLGTVFILAT